MEERRKIELRHARFNAALVTSTIYNANRPPESEVLTPFDFIAGFEDPEEKEKARKRKDIKRQMGAAMHRLPLDATPEEAAAMKARVISGANAEGFDGEELYREIFPD